jgi:hypothetical protein
MAINDPVIAAFMARYDTWANKDACPLSRLNEDNSSPLPAFTELELPIRNEDIPAVGVYRDNGVFRPVIHVLSLDGVDEATGWVEELRNLYRGATFGGLRCSWATGATFDRNNRRGAFYVLPFLIHYDFDRLT